MDFRQRAHNLRTMVVRYIRRHADEMRHIILMEIAAGRRDQDGNPFLGTDDEKFEGLL